MARGGKKKGAGRPKGSTTRPQLRDFYTDKELFAFVADLKETAKTDPLIKKFVAEQIFGKAPQAIDVTSKGEAIKTNTIVVKDFSSEDEADNQS